MCVVILFVRIVPILDIVITSFMYCHQPFPATMVFNSLYHTINKRLVFDVNGDFKRKRRRVFFR